MAEKKKTFKSLFLLGFSMKCVINVLLQQLAHIFPINTKNVKKLRSRADEGKRKRKQKPMTMLKASSETMKLHEIYEGIQFTNIMDIAERIVVLMRSRKFGKPVSAADWQWLKLTCENQSVIR